MRTARITTLHTSAIEQVSWTRIVVLLSLTVTIFSSGMDHLQAAEHDDRTADQEMALGRDSQARGAVAQSAVHWMEAARLYEQEGHVKKQSQALTHLAYALLQDGQVRQANLTLQTALQLSESLGDRVQTAVILGQLGNTAIALGQSDVAIDHLTKARSLAREAKKPAIEAALLNDLGNALALARQRIPAVDAYVESRALATQTAQAPLALTALINSAMALIANGQYGQAQQSLDLAFTETRRVSDSPAKAYGLLNIGLGYDDLRAAVTSPKQIADADRSQTNEPCGVRGLCVSTNPSAATSAPPVAQPLSDGTSPKQKAESQPPGATLSRGKRSLEVTGNPSASPNISRDSKPALTPPSSSNTSLAQQAAESFQQAADIAARLGDTRGEAYALGYLGSLRENEGRYQEALALTRNAVFVAQKANAADSLYQWHWQTARLLKATGNQAGALSAYQRAVSILKPIRHQYSVGYQGRHHSFRDSVAPLFLQLEDMLLRQAEQSRDGQKTQQLLRQVQDAAETSRIAELQDYYRDDCVANARGKGGGVDAIPDKTAVIYPIMLPDRLELLVQTTTELQRVGVQISADQLTQEATIFRAAIQDRRSTNYIQAAQQLYRRLLGPLQADLTAHGIHTLVFVPDGPLRGIPMTALHDGQRFAIDTYAIAVTPSMQLTDTHAADLSHASLLSMGLTESVRAFPALPNIAAEIDALKTLFGGTPLMNKQFVVPSVEQEIRVNDVGIVHIASHGQWNDEASKSFLLAYDDNISMDRLSQLVGLLEYRPTPLELITLSACQTAIGDDRAALGMAGVAVKAGARSALATLWFVDDQATSELVAEFYRLLHTQSLSKAKALQRAQQTIKNQPGYAHPSFWAPFLLISNWM